MKYSITLASFRNVEPLERTLPRLGAMGFDAVEMFGEPESTAAIEILKSYDMPVNGVTGMWGAISKDSSTRRLICSDQGLLESAKKYVRACVNLCSMLGGKEFNVCLFGDEETRDMTHVLPQEHAKEKMIVRSAETLSELCKYAKDYGVSLVLEPLNRYSTPYCSTARDAARIVSLVRDPDSLGILLDTFHMNIEEDSFAEAIQTAGLLLKHAHFADNNRKMPGFAHIDFREIMKSLRQVGYDGYISFEPNIHGGDYRDEIMKGLDFVKNLSTQQAR